jgi:mannan endo-1,6-alpha-mannosidase
MFEFCEVNPKFPPLGNCDADQETFKAYTAQWMANTIKLCPWTEDTIMPLLQASATAAAAQCE